MDRSVRDDDREPFFHLSSSSSSPALAQLDASLDPPPPTSTDDVLAGYNFRSASLPRRRIFPVDQASSRRQRSSGSPVYLTGELFSARKDTEMDSYHLKTVSAVERSIKKYADNILRVLEGMNGRLSHLESVTQVLEQSVASLKGSVHDYHGEANSRLKTLDSHVIEMHRAVQILRDKQDIVETNAELAKLQASKAEAVVERASAVVPTVKQTVVASSEIRNQENLALALVVPKRSSTLFSQHSTEVSGQPPQQLSLSGDINTTPQHIPAQTQILQQPHVLSSSETRPILQPQLMTQSTPGLFQAEPQHSQAPQNSQLPQQGLLQTQAQQVQVQESVQFLPGVQEAHQYYGQTPQIAPSSSQQGTFQQHAQIHHIAQSQQGQFQKHVQAQHNVQGQQPEVFQGQQQLGFIQQSSPAQDGTGPTLQYPLGSQQNAPYQHSTYQAQAHRGLLQESGEVRQGAFQAQTQNVHIQQSAQSQQVPYQAQQQQAQTQQNAQAQQMLTQAQSQQVHTQAFQAQTQNVHIQQSAQSQQIPYQAQQQQAQTQQNAQAQQRAAQAQAQAQSQQVLTQAFRGPQPSPPAPPPASPSQTVNQGVIYSDQPQFQMAPQHLNMQQLATTGQPAAQIPHLQYGLKMTQSPPTQIDYGAGGPPYNVPYMASSQPVQQQAHNVYQYPVQGPLPAQRARPAIPSATSVRALPVAENVYTQANIGEPSSSLSHSDGVMEKLGAMGYSRADVWSAIKRLLDQGKQVDVNGVLDLINARSQSQGGWQAR